MNTLSMTLLTAATLASVSLLDAADPPKAQIGDPFPDVEVRTAKDKEFSILAAVKAKPAVVVYYRGAWCPYCSKHLAALAAIDDDLEKLGFQMFAVSADQPSKLYEKPAYTKLPFSLLSDSSMKLAKALGIVFQVPEDTVTKYKEEFSIDLEAASGQKHHLLPHPSVFVVNKEGVIRFAYINEDYKERLKAEDVLKAAREVATEKG